MVNEIALNFLDEVFEKSEIYGIKPLGLDALDIVGMYVFFFQAEDGIRDSVASRGLGDVYKTLALKHLTDICLMKLLPKSIGIRQDVHRGPRSRTSTRLTGSFAAKRMSLL